MTDRRGLRDRLPGSVRARITALAALLVAVVLLVTSMVVVAVQERVLMDGVDDNLRIRADDLEQLLEATADPSDVVLSTSTDTVAQLVGADGSVRAASHPAALDAPLGPAPAAGEETIVSSESIPVDDDEFRLLSRGLADGTVLHVADAVDDLREGVGTLRGALVVASLLATAVLAGVVWWLVGRALRPVEAIRAEVATMAGEEVHRRVPEPGADDEIGRLARTMNEMLARVEEAQLRQRRFAADASHELRSPLARIRTELEVDLAHPDHADPLDTHRSVLEETEVLQRMIDDLLVLARGERGLPPTATVLDLDDIVLHAADDLRSRPDLTLDASGVSAAPVHGDQIQLRRAVSNLLDNAGRHAASTVTLTLAEVDGVARFTVADDGPGIPAVEHERIFERFTRLDEARARGDGGTGLGLAIAREIVERHGGSLTLDPDHTPGARFVLEVPSQEPVSGDSRG